MPIKLKFKGGFVKNYFVVTMITAALLVSAVSRADVVVKTKSNTEMAGIMSMQTDGVNNIKDDKSYNSMTTQMTGGMVAMLGKGKPKDIVNITRLDKGLYWELDTEKKNYKETTMEELKKQFADARSKGKKGEEPEYVWTVEVKAIDGSQTISGFTCNGVLGKATGVSKKNVADSMFISYEQWAAKDVPGAAEVKEYQQNYAKAVGIDEMWAKENMGSMLKQYGSEFAELAIKVSESGGYPIRTIIIVEGAAKPQGEESEKTHGGAMGMMSKMLGKKADKQENDKGGRMKTFSFANEVISIEQKSIGDSQFEIPEGYKKK
jgi:hypothetical protein